jgi:hypothetical protein
MNEKNGMKIAMGSHVKDVVSGFEGIVAAYTFHLTGCDVVAIKSRGLDKDGKSVDAFWVDVNRVEVLGPPPPEIKKVIESTLRDEEPIKGGPQENCPERNDV